MNFLDGYIEAGRRIKSKAARHEYYGSIIDYFVGDGEVPQFKNEVAEVGFYGVKFSIDKARAGKVGGQSKQTANETPSKPRSKRQATAQAKPQANAKQTANETPTKEEEEEVLKERVAKATPKKDQAGSLDGIDDEQFASFAKSAVQSFEDITGRPYRIPQATVIVSLRRIHDAGYTLDDVEAVIRSRLADWDGDAKMAKFIRPSTLFGDKFEGYLAASKQSTGAGVIDDELASYAEIFEP